MSITTKYFRVRLLVLAALVLTAVGFASDPSADAACRKCVFPTGGICVGCMDAGEGDEGFRTCTPIQDICSCIVGGGACTGTGLDPGGGGDN